MSNDKLEPITEPCDECGRLRTTSEARIDKDGLWLIAPECPCGEAGDLCVFRPGKEGQDLTRTLFKLFSGETND